MSKSSVILLCPICREKTMIKTHNVDRELQRNLTMGSYVRLLRSYVDLRNSLKEEKKKRVMTRLPWPVINLEPSKRTKRARFETDSSSSDSSAASIEQKESKNIKGDKFNII